MIDELKVMAATARATKTTNEAATMAIVATARAKEAKKRVTP